MYCVRLEGTNVNKMLLIYRTLSCVTYLLDNYLCQDL